MEPRPIELTPHAHGRYQIMYPHASAMDLWKALEEGIVVEPRTAHALAGRNQSGIRLRGGNQYILHQDRTGMFAIDTRARVLKTFLRFNDPQVKQALRLYPLVERVQTAEEKAAYEQSLLDMVRKRGGGNRPALPVENSKNETEPVETLMEDTGYSPDEKPLTAWEKDQKLCAVALPHLQWPARLVSITPSVLKEVFQGVPHPLRTARLALARAGDTITPIRQDLCSVDVAVPGDTMTLFLVRQREFERAGPEWWLCQTEAAKLPEIEVRMALMLTRRGWDCRPPAPE